MCRRYTRTWLLRRQAGNSAGRREPTVVANVKAAQVRRSRFAKAPEGLRIRLLGPMRIVHDGKPVAVPAKKARALVGYLTLREGSEVPRSVLTGLLWGERSEEQARGSLRQTLSELRTAFADLTPQPIIATKEAVCWVSGSAWIDAKAVDAMAASGDEEALRRAAALIDGELMEGLAVGERASSIGFRPRAHGSGSSPKPSTCDSCNEPNRAEDWRKPSHMASSSSPSIRCRSMFTAR
jgi:hypothetical protein